ncbi:uncharacterized protein At1g32220, chloroplastic-like [Brassica napus]|uniref:uncharacterized protein At1g32220, chloroplastic-like n=1 Tax=Brassica napus TaxID=3708 RepID=UPI002079E862|nr:uncharacterized protein At1g32220, chloroplastic-like [Brassica napus]
MGGLTVTILCSSIYAEASIDIVADIKSERVVLLGGNGFVGSAICKAAISNRIESGHPNFQDSWLDQVTWVTGDVFYLNWNEVLLGATTSLIVCAWVLKFVLLTVHDYNLSPVVLSSGYFTEKRVVLRSGFIYRKRKVNGFEVPLDLVGEPLDKIGLDDVNCV